MDALCTIIYRAGKITGLAFREVHQVDFDIVDFYLVRVFLDIHLTF